MVRTIERIENLLFGVFGIYLFHHFSNNWILFFLVILVPDISMLGYLIDKRVGGITYNLVHNYVLAIILLILGLLTNQNFFYVAISILICHTGFDRFFGFGLKYGKNFKETHIQKL